MINPLVVFTPREQNNYNFKRFLISYNRLEFYIGKENAIAARLRRERSKADKVTVRFRKYGKIEIYEK